MREEIEISFRISIPDTEALLINVATYCGVDDSSEITESDVVEYLNQHIKPAHSLSSAFDVLGDGYGCGWFISFAEVGRLFA